MIQRSHELNGFWDPSWDPAWDSDPESNTSIYRWVKQDKLSYAHVIGLSAEVLSLWSLVCVLPLYLSLGFHLDESLCLGCSQEQFCVLNLNLGTIFKLLLGSCSATLNSSYLWHLKQLIFPHFFLLFFFNFFGRIWMKAQRQKQFLEGSNIFNAFLSWWLFHP